MNISNYYWYFSGVLTPKFCDDVIAYAKEQKEVMARTGGFGDRKLKKEEVLDLKRKRNSDLVWLNDTWIYNCLLYTSPSPRDGFLSRMPSSA